MNKTRLKVGTDFSGIGAPEMALNNLGIEYDQVFSCEIDKHARKSYDAIHKAPGKFYIDITKRNHSEVDQLDLYVAGFPCQAFSLAGQRKGFDDVRGTLFFEVANFIKVNQPKMFVLENVRGLLSHDNGRTYQTIIDILTNGGGTLNSQMSLDVFDDGLGYHCYAQVLNTKHYGIPQNRERIFIVGFKEFRKFSFPKKQPLNLKLKDILQGSVEEKYFLSEKAINGILNTNFNQYKAIIQDVEKVCGCLLSTDYKSTKCVKVKSATKKGYEIAKEGDSISIVQQSKTRRGRVGKQVAQTISTSCNQGILKYAKEIEHSINQDVCTGLDASYYKGFGVRQGKCRQLVENNFMIRRLTPLECFRLQAFPDDAFFEAQKVCSDTQLYKQAGNSISVNVLEKLFKQML
jgi:DNA (cytosine-5)-methyltransferase 1